MSQFPFEALERAIWLLGGPTKAARLIGISRQTLYDWRYKGVPEKYRPHLADLCKQAAAKLKVPKPPKATEFIRVYD